MSLRDALIEKVAERLDDDCGCGEEEVEKLDWNPGDHPRGPGGRFIRSIFGGASAEHGEQGEAMTLRDATSLLQDIVARRGRHPSSRKGRLKAKLGRPIDCGADCEKAARLLAAGRAVRLDQPNYASTLLDRLADIAKEAESKGINAPNFDLCKVSVKKTNLFCVKNKGIPRVQMPQLKGVPTPGSPASKMKHDKRGEVDLSEEFLKYLEDRGIPVFLSAEKAENLRATQNQLDGPKVGQMMRFLAGGGAFDGPPIWTSRDDYIVDGHHRWAATVGHDLADNHRDVEIEIRRVDASIPVVLAYARQFTREQGLPQVGISDGHGPAPIDAPKIPATAQREPVETAIGNALDRAEDRAGLPHGEGRPMERLLAILARLQDLIHYRYFHHLEKVPGDVMQEALRFQMGDEAPGEKAPDLYQHYNDTTEFMQFLSEHEGDLLHMVSETAQHYLGKFDPHEPRNPHTGEWVGSLGITPFRGAGRSSGADYFSTTRFKGFESAVAEEAKGAGVKVEGIDRARGIWAGGGEPSTQVRVKGRDAGVRQMMDALGHRFNQDAVIAFRPRKGGAARRFRTKDPIGGTDKGLEQMISRVNAGRPEGEQIQGATRLPDGRVEFVDLDGSAVPAIRELASRAGWKFTYNRGDGELRFKGQHYPGGGRGGASRGPGLRGGGAGGRGGVDDHPSPADLRSMSVDQLQVLQAKLDASGEDDVLLRHVNIEISERFGEGAAPR